MRLPRMARACAWCFQDSSSICLSATNGAVIEGTGRATLLGIIAGSGNELSQGIEGRDRRSAIRLEVG